MQKLLRIIKENKLAVSILGVAVLMIVFFVVNALHMNSTNSQPTRSQNPNSLYQELLSVYNNIPTQSGKTNFLKQSNNLTKRVDPELVDLDSQIITCSANVDSLLSNQPSTGGSCVGGNTPLSSIKGKYLSGQCCGTLMDTKERHENLEKLQAYKGMPDIPLDPMHTPIDMAKRWIDYDNATKLTAEEQKVYDQAYAISKEKPCCCKCWHYFVDEGIAKKMIKDGTFNAKQIADFWDASDICGV